MKYNLRFFLNEYCFANFKSEHLPCKGSLLYVGDDSIDNKHKQNIEPGTIFKVISKVFIYNDYGDDEDHLSSVEITVKKTDK